MDIISTEDLAREAGVSRQMITGRWGREGLDDVAKVARGRWDREKALIWIADRREDSAALNGIDRKGTSSDLLSARIRLYEEQGKGAAMRNQLLEANVVYRESAIEAYTEATQEQISVGDAWTRDVTTPAAKGLAKLGATQAQILALKQELWNELRTVQAESIRRVGGTLSIGEDVGSTRVRIPRRMGG